MQLHAEGTWSKCMTKQNNSAYLIALIRFILLLQTTIPNLLHFPFLTLNSKSSLFLDTINAWLSACLRPQTIFTVTVVSQYDTKSKKEETTSAWAVLNILQYPDF
jgi:hypothetical protein